MKDLLFIPLISMLFYLAYIKVRYGMTYSISATAKKHRYGWEKAWFMATLVLGVALPVIIYGLETSQNSNFQFLWFLAGAAISFVGAAQVYWNGGLEYKVHMAGSYAGIILGVIACLVHVPSPLTFLIIGAFIFFALSQLIDDLQTKNSTYWIEVAALVTVIGALYFN